jgi:hypothetical protein
LSDALGAKGKLTVAEAADVVLAKGYKSKSKDFQNIASMTLSTDKRFRRVRRGVYALRGWRLSALRGRVLRTPATRAAHEITIRAGDVHPALDYRNRIH